jgi:DoxX-like family
MNVSVVLAALIAVIFTALGAAKILAVPPMQARAAHAGLSVAAYRRIGLLEVAGAAGVLIGLIRPLLGGMASVGLLLLLGGAVVTHLRNHDGPREVAPAVVCAVLAAGYLAALMGTVG